MTDSAARTPDADYPPARTGMRGSGYPGAYAVGHALRDGDFWASAPAEIDTGESYDLVVVGGGISGLSAAYFYRQLFGPQARVLVLDNHDDFGGHAKRVQYGQGSSCASPMPARFGSRSRTAR